MEMGPGRIPPRHPLLEDEVHEKPQGICTSRQTETGRPTDEAFSGGADRYEALWAVVRPQNAGGSLHQVSGSRSMASNLKARRARAVAIDRRDLEDGRAERGRDRLEEPTRLQAKARIELTEAVKAEGKEKIGRALEHDLGLLGGPAHPLGIPVSDRGVRELTSECVLRLSADRPSGQAQGSRSAQVLLRWAPMPVFHQRCGRLRFVGSLPLVALALLGVQVEASPLKLEPLALATRQVGFSEMASMPSEGAVYVRLGRPLRRPEIEAAKAQGARYLGMAGPSVYAWALTGPAASTWLRDFDPALGVAKVLPEDKMRPDLAGWLGRGERFDGQVGLWVSFWPRATGAELRSLLGPAALGRRSEDLSAPLGLDASVRIEGPAAKWVDLPRLLAHPAVAAVGLDLPRALTNASSRSVAGSDVLAQAPLTLTGEGILVGHWDGGAVDTSHGDFDSRVDNLTQTGVDGHATHTAGTVLGSGAGRGSAAGHAPGARMVALSFNGNPTAERREVKHLRYHHHDNHSWGVNSQLVDNYGTYNQVAFEFDIDSRDLLLLPVKAAGNDGQSSEVIIDNFGFDSLSPDSTSKNAMVVGACDDRGNLAPFSSRGPVEDGRIKPDLVAVGVDVVSTVPGGGYGAAQGTSMSTPGVTGMLALLAELFERGSGGRRMAPDVARGVLIHTAVDAYNVGPDYRYGWGIASAEAAAALISEDQASGGHNLVRGAVRDGARAELSFDVPANTPELKLTLSWLDAFFNFSTQRQLLNDIDLVLVDPSGTQHQPWILDPANPANPATRGRNSVDNVEQVLVANPQPGRWQAIVTGTSITDPDLDVQGFVLVSDIPLERNLARVVAGTPGTPIPDGQGVLEVSFPVSSAATVDALRVFLDIKHEARGNVRVELVHPDGTAVTLETEDSSTRRDIYAIYPDLRSYDDDVVGLYGKAATGTWTLRIRDLEAGATGELRYAELELDLGGPANQPPTAVIEGPEEGELDAVVVFSGKRSSDPDGDPLSYAWSQASGPQAELRNATTDTLELTLPSAAVGEIVELSLVVEDGRGGQNTATQRVTLLAGNGLPTPVLSGPGSARPGETVTLDASASTDPDGDALTFVFRQTAGPSAEVQANPEPAQLVLLVPDGEAGTTLEWEVEADDGRGGRASARHSLTLLAPEDGGSGTGSGGGTGAGGEGTGGEGGELEVGSGCRSTQGQGLGLTGLLLFVWGFRRRERKS